MSDGRLRIVNVLDNLNTGGTELNAVRTAEHLVREGYDIRFLCVQPDGPLRQRLDTAGIPVTSVGVTGLASWGAVRRGLEIRAMVRRERIHVVHAHDPYGNVLAAPWVRLAGQASVIASHRWWRQVHSARVRFANRIAYRFAHCILANSEAVGELVVREEGVPRGKLVVVPNFVDASGFEPLTPQRRQALRERMGLRPDDLAIGIVANLYPVKDHGTLVRAAARLAARWPSLRLVFVGDGSERDALDALARAAGVRDRVLMPGRLAHEPGMAGAFEIGVLSSREEGFPNYVVEAMAAGRPVVATRVGGVVDAVQEGETGFLVAAGDDAVFAARLEDLAESASLRERMGQAGERRARLRYHVDVVLASLKRLYHDLAAAGRGRLTPR